MRLDLERECAPLQWNPTAYEESVKAIRQSDARLTPNTPAPDVSFESRSTDDLVDGYRERARRQTLLAVTAGVAVVVSAVVIGILRLVRRELRYPVDETLALVNEMIPAEVRAKTPEARATRQTVIGGRGRWISVAVNSIVALVLVGVGAGLVVLGAKLPASTSQTFENMAWFIPLIAIPFAFFYASVVKRRATKVVGSKYEILGLEVEKMPGVVEGPNIAGAESAPIKPYLAGFTVVAGVRNGRRVQIQRDTSLRIKVTGATPIVDAVGRRGVWTGTIPPRVAPLLDATGTGPGTVAVAADGQGVSVIRSMRSGQWQSVDAFGIEYRDLHLAESICDLGSTTTQR